MKHFIRQSYIFISNGDEAVRFLLGILMFHFATTLYYHVSLLPAEAGLSSSFLLCRRPSGQFLSPSFSHNIASHLLTETAGSLKAMKSMTNPVHNFYILVINWHPPERYYEVNGLSEAGTIRPFHTWGTMTLICRAAWQCLGNMGRQTRSAPCGEGRWDLWC